MFGWEIGFGVGLFVGSITLFSNGQWIWGIILLILAIVLAIDSFNRVHTVKFYVSSLTVSYYEREDKNTFPKPHDYWFSGTISVKVPTETAIREFYLELQNQDKKERANLLVGSPETLDIGYVLKPSHPEAQPIHFQVYRQEKFEPSPESAIVVIRTTDWGKRESVTLIYG